MRIPTLTVFRTKPIQGPFWLSEPRPHINKLNPGTPGADPGSTVEDRAS
jgi:hypothetical protein